MSTQEQANVINGEIAFNFGNLSMEMGAYAKEYLAQIPKPIIQAIQTGIDKWISTNPPLVAVKAMVDRDVDLITKNSLPEHLVLRFLMDTSKQSGAIWIVEELIGNIDQAKASLSKEHLNLLDEKLVFQVVSGGELWERDELGNQAVKRIKASA